MFVGPGSMTRWPYGHFSRPHVVKTIVNSDDDDVLGRIGRIVQSGIRRRRFISFLALGRPYDLGDLIGLFLSRLRERNLVAFRFRIGNLADGFDVLPITSVN